LLLNRVEERIRGWGICVEERRETQTAFLAFGTRNGEPVVLKVFCGFGDEWNSGAVLEAFDGIGTVRVCERVEGAVLLERLRPGIALTRLVWNGKDEEATRIIAGVIQRMSNPSKTLTGAPSVEHWGKGFERYRASGDQQVPAELVKQAHDLYAELCSSQKDIRLLHGDLHHENILFDSERGWVAVDPKGVFGELEYEIGASLRNPVEKPELFASTVTIKRRLAIYGDQLQLDVDRAMAWSFAGAVLSAIWSVEDGSTVHPDDPVLVLARAMKPLIR
jgi:streptomycin 6-kinase